MNAAIKRSAKAELTARSFFAKILWALNVANVFIYAFSEEFALYEYNGFDIPELSILLFAVILIISALLCISLFDDMHFPDKADIQLSLPISARERFTARVIIFAKAAILPYLLCSALIFILFAGRVIINIMADSAVSSDDFLYFLSIFYEGLVCLSFAGGAAFVCSALTSSRAGAAATTFIGCIVITHCPYIIYSFIIDCANIYSAYIPPLSLCSFGLSGYMFTKYVDPADDSHLSIMPQFFLAGLVNIIISLVLFFIAYKVYTKRERKSIFENRYTRLFMLIFMSLTAAVAVSFALGLAGLAAALTAAAAVIAIYLLILTKSGKGQKRKWLISICTVNACIIAFLIAAIKTQGFGISKLPMYMEDDRLFQMIMQTSERHDKIIKEDNNELMIDDLNYADLEKAEEILKEYQERSSYEPRADHIFGGYLKKEQTPENGDTMIYIVIRSRDLASSNSNVSESYYYIKESDTQALINRLSEIAE